MHKKLIRNKEMRISINRFAFYHLISLELFPLKRCDAFGNSQALAYLHDVCAHELPNYHVV